ncbi:H-NS histone family protein [Paracoccus gahaiensis]|uniref:H-NS histone family protein n=1 Tax=Paracoccus gahaiensis TaxID=1706839 RepID=A0A4U0R1T7_9RHOB|nr:H-NS histone family protein [Paracoccus gahaiensis]TJZ88705.1 H-NS histone family protein [Paracoccus gahaiensis]
MKSIKRDLDKVITDFDQCRKAEAKRDLEAKAREYGFSLTELVDFKSSKRGPVAAKYRNPENSDQTWSGRKRDADPLLPLLI